MDQLGKRPLAADRERITWSQAREWWAGRSELLRAEWFPVGPPRDEFIYSIDGSGADRQGRLLLAVYSYDEQKPGSHTEWQILDAGGTVLRFTYVPPGSVPPYAHPIYVTKVVETRGRPAKLWEARRSKGANVDVRVIYWETQPANASGALIQYSISASPGFYTEEEQVGFIDRLVPVT